MNLKTCHLIEKGSHANLLLQTPTTELQKTITCAFIKYRRVAMKYMFKLVMNQLKASYFVLLMPGPSEFTLNLQQYLM